MLVNTESGGGIKYELKRPLLAQIDSGYKGPGVVFVSPDLKIASTIPTAVREFRDQPTHFTEKDIWEDCMLYSHFSYSTKVVMNEIYFAGGF